MKTAADIDRQAVAWVTRLDAQPASESLQRQLRTWLDADVRHRVAYLRLNAAWEKSQIAERLRPLNGPVDRDLLAPPGARIEAFRTSRPWSLVAGAACLSVLVGLYFYARSGDKTFATSVGSFERILLEDGSVVDLNTDSELTVQINDLHRLVSLKRGEARFRVAHDATRPFEVIGGGRRVRAVGTEFVVSLKNSTHAEVLVTEGRVVIVPMDAGETDAGPGAPMIKAGEKVTVAADRLTVQRLSDAAVARRIAWTEGKIVLEEEPLAAAVTQFNRYNTVKLVIADSALQNLRVGGTFDAGDVSSFIAALDRVFEIRAESSGDNTVRLLGPVDGKPALDASSQE